MTNAEQEKRFRELSAVVGETIAAFIFCGFFDIPFDINIQAHTWTDYMQQAAGLDTKGFINGITDITVAAEAELSDEERWEAEWGIGDEANPYSEKDYRRLDELFRTFSSRLRGAGGMDALQEDTLRNCSKMRLAADKALAKGGKDNISIASTLSKMIQDNLSAEQLRKKDAKPVEQARIDGIVEAIAKKWGKGIELSYEDAVAICSQWLAEHKYPITTDAADHMLLSIINCTRGNNDMPEMDELPQSMKFDRRYSTQFAEEPNEIESEVFKYLNLARESQRPKEAKQEKADG